MNQPVLILEKTLRAWEDFWFLTGLYNQALEASGQRPFCSNTRAVKNWMRYRKSLLDRGVKTAKNKTQKQTENIEEFSAPLDYPVEDQGCLLIRFPATLFGWCADSRRVYHVSAETQAILAHTTLKGVRWSDVKLSFASFAVELENPIISKHGLRFSLITVDSMLFFSDPNHPEKTQAGLLLTLFCDSILEYQPLSSVEKDRLTAQARRKKWSKIIQPLRFLCAQIPRKVKGTNYIIPEGHLESPVLESVERCWEAVPEDQGSDKKKVPMVDKETWMQMARVVVGLALYLQALPSNSSHVSKPRPPFRSGKPDPRSIVNPAEICHVSSIYQLDRTDRIMLGLEKGEPGERAQFEMRCHFREAHWRRPPGKGDDPTAEKTVHVKWAMIRRDRLPEGALPGGTTKHV